MSLLGAQHIGVPLTGTPKIPGNAAIMAPFDAPCRLNCFSGFNRFENGSLVSNTGGGNIPVTIPIKDNFSYYFSLSIDARVNTPYSDPSYPYFSYGPGLVIYIGSPLTYILTFQWKNSLSYQGIELYLYNYPSYSLVGGPIHYYPGPKDTAWHKWEIRITPGGIYWILDGETRRVLSGDYSRNSYTFTLLSQNVAYTTFFRQFKYERIPSYTLLELERHFGKNRV